MTTIESQVDVRSAPLLPRSTRLGPIRIAVTDRERALATWRDVVGLVIVAENAGEVLLGVGETPLVILKTGAARPVIEGTTGLYHVAIHVPSRVDLAQFAARALQRRVRIAPTDHLVSEAIYLWDADNNGIEITFETPWRGRIGAPDEGVYVRTADGEPHSGREPIDLEGLLAELGERPVLQPTMPEGTRIGHVHLHVNDLDAALGFYRDGLGFGGLFVMRGWGMGDVGLGYMPHAIAFNIWAGRNARPAPPDAAGLRWFEISVPDESTFDAVRERFGRMGVAMTALPDGGGIAVRDPAANEVRIRVAGGP